MMIRLIAIPIAIVIACAGEPADARKAANDPARFLCANLKIACSKRPAKPKRDKKPVRKTAKAPAKPLAKPVAEAPKPAPVKPVPKPEPRVELQPSQPEQKQAVVAPTKPVQKPAGGGEVVPAPREGPPPADNGAACRADLVQLGADMEIPQGFEPGQGCSVANPVLLKSLRTRTGSVALPGRPILNCAFAKRFVTWLDDVAAPIVAAHEDAALAALSTGTGFQCRGRNGEPAAKMSEHAFGNAIDIDGLVVGGRKRIEIAAVSDSTNPAYRLLMALRISACGYFTTVLGPGSNAAHASHYHFDLGIHGKSGNYRICE
jgi:hypothetical protein